MTREQMRRALRIDETISDVGWRDFDCLFKSFTQLDGTLLGIKMEED